MTELCDLTLTELLPRLARRDISAAELRASCRARIAAAEFRIGAWEQISDESDIGGSPALLGGIPFGVKDTFDVAGLQAERGSPIYRGRIAREDAACVAAFRAAGIVPLGKTVTTEFAYFRPGKTTNPHNAAHTPGGSSSGSAAAVAAGMVPFALGSQTAASVIRPAAYCGVVGYVASLGCFPLRGVLPLAQSFDALGLLARTAADIHLLCSILRGSFPDEEFLPARPLRLMAFDGTGFGDIDAGMADAFEAAMRQLSEAGIDIRRCRKEGFGKDWVECHKKLMAHEAAANFVSEYTNHRELLSPQFRALIEEGRSPAAAEVEALRTKQARDAMRLNEILESCDAIIAPSAPGPAPRGLAATGSPHMSRPWQLFGLPQCTLPFGMSPDRLPLGIQLVGRRFGDRNLLMLSAWLQNALGWHAARPDLSKTVP